MEDDTKWYEYILGGLGCLGMGAFQLIMAALPIALAILIVLWLLRGC